MSFPDLLAESAARTGTCACMGLDPVPAVVPAMLSESLSAQEKHSGTAGGVERIAPFFRKLFVEMKRLSLVPAAFKPNIGFYQRLDTPLEGDFSGSRALAEVITLLRELFPDIPVILDAKRGDIAGSSKNYAGEAFETWKADAVTVHPLMGDDSVGPFLEKADELGGGVYILNRTSNPGASRFQNLEVLQPREKGPLADRAANPAVEGASAYQSESGSAPPAVLPLYLEVAKSISEWATDHGSAGAVVGATSLDELENILGSYTRNPVPLLIPGVGSQGGSAKDVLGLLRDYGYPLELVRINSSSGVTHPWKKRGEEAPEEWIDEVLAALHRLIDACAVE